MAYSCGPFGRNGRIVSVHVTGYISHRSCAWGQGVSGGEKRKKGRRKTGSKCPWVQEEKKKGGGGGKSGGEGKDERTVVSGLIGRLRVISVPPSFAIFAFLRWSRRSWFFFMRAISSSNLHINVKKRFSGGKGKGGGEWCSGNKTHRFFARASRSLSPVGANVSAPVVSSSMICRRRTYARMTAASRTISVDHLPSM